MKQDRIYPVKVCGNRTVVARYRGLSGGMPLFEDVVTGNRIRTDEFEVMTLEKGRERAPVIALDFDGTIAEYDPPAFPEIGQPIKGAKEFVDKLYEKGMRVVVFTCRAAAEVQNWLEEHQFKYDGVNIDPYLPNTNSGKPIADVYMDDRGLHFSGNYDQALKEITSRVKPATSEAVAEEAGDGETSPEETPQPVSEKTEEHPDKTSS